MLNKATNLFTKPTPPVDPDAPSVKATKIDRQSLRRMKISNPIPQNVIDLPSKVVAIRPAPPPPTSPSKVGISCTLPRLPKSGKVHFDVEEDTASEPVKGSVERSESMRMKGVTPRPTIPQFGSMRGKRPLSLFARPTSPPPNPPPAAAPQHIYDDCLNKSTEEDAIYATIENVESQEKENKKDLLDEIVSELKKKNIDDVSPVRDVQPSLVPASTLPTTTTVAASTIFSRPTYINSYY